MKNFSDTIGNRTRGLPACSVVPQPTAPPRDQSTFNELFNRLCTSAATKEKLGTDILKCLCGGELFPIVNSVRNEDFHECWSIKVGRQVVHLSLNFYTKKLTGFCC